MSEKFTQALELGLAGAQAGTNLINMKLQKDVNRQNRQFAREMFMKENEEKQRFWNLQNEFNHPLQQMQRLKEAGLNPHLVYGKGAANTASPINSAAGKTATALAPRIEQGNILTRAQAIRGTALQNDNIQAQYDLIEQERLLKAAQTFKTLTEGKRGEFDLGLQQQVRDQLIQKIQLENDLNRQTLNLNLSKDKREWMKYNLSTMYYDIEKLEFARKNRETNAKIRSIEQSIDESAQRIRNMVTQELHEKLKMSKTVAEKDRIRADIKRVKSEAGIKKMTYELYKRGLHPDAPSTFKSVMLPSLLDKDAGGGTTIRGTGHTFKYMK